MTLIINGANKAEDEAPVIPNATQGILTSYQYKIAPAVGSNTAIHADIALTTSSQTITTAITNPDFPRALLIKGNQAAIAGNVVINGKDAAGGTIADTIALNEASAVNGIMAFKSVVSIVVPARTSTGDLVSIGTQNVFGLPHVVPSTMFVIKQLFDGSTDAGTLSVNAALSKNIYTLAGTPDSTKFFAMMYFHE